MQLVFSFLLLLLFDLGISQFAKTYAADSPPVIVSEPQDCKWFTRSPLQLSVVAEGPGPLAYAWYYDERTYSIGEEATLNYPYTLNGVRKFYVDVTNPFGTTRSRTITVTFVS